jgi:hypothetical protein
MHFETIQSTAFSMKGINYLAALGTIFIFVAIYAFKAAFAKKIVKEQLTPEPVNKNVKIGLILFSICCLVLGLFLIGTSLGIL